MPVTVRDEVVTAFTGNGEETMAPAVGVQMVTDGETVLAVHAGGGGVPLPTVKLITESK